MIVLSLQRSPEMKSISYNSFSSDLVWIVVVKSEHVKKQLLFAVFCAIT